MCKREFPFSRVKQDTVAQPFRNKEYAELCREIMQRMTGDVCAVSSWGVERGGGSYRLERCVGERWILA